MTRSFSTSGLIRWQCTLAKTNLCSKAMLIFRIAFVGLINEEFFEEDNGKGRLTSMDLAEQSSINKLASFILELVDGSSQDRCTKLQGK